MARGVTPARGELTCASRGQAWHLCCGSSRTNGNMRCALVAPRQMPSMGGGQAGAQSSPRSIPGLQLLGAQGLGHGCVHPPPGLVLLPPACPQCFTEGLSHPGHLAVDSFLAAMDNPRPKQGLLTWTPLDAAFWALRTGGVTSVQPGVEALVLAQGPHCSRPHLESRVTGRPLRGTAGSP